MSAASRRWPLWQLGVLAVLCLGGCGFFSIAGLLFLSPSLRIASSKSSGDSGSREFVFIPNDYDFRFTCKLAEWQKASEESEKNLQPILVMQRKKPASTLVICARDLHGRIPGEETLKDMTTTHLKLAFRDLKRSNHAGKFAGKDALRSDIQGYDSSGDFVVGQCYVIVHDAVAFLFITWRKENTSEESRSMLGEEWEKLRDGFTLIEKASNERPTIKKTLFEGKDRAKSSYALYGLAALWKESPQPQTKDIDLALFGRDLSLGSVKRDAEVRVRLLPGQNDQDKAVEEEKKRVEEMVKQRWKDAAIEKVEVETLDEAKNAQVGKDKEPCRLLRLRVSVPERQFDVFFRIVLVARRERLLIVECECDWGVRSVWEPDFEQLLDSLYFKKAE